MTRLDAAALHTWLTDQIALAQATADETHNAPDQMPTLLGAFDRARTYLDIDGWLRRQATDQLHRHGHTLDPEALLAHPSLRIATEDAHAWITARAAATTIETRAKTYQAVANQLARFTIDSTYREAFPYGDDTEWWAGPPRQRRWPTALVAAIRRRMSP